MHSMFSPPHGREKQSREVPISGYASHIPDTDLGAAGVQTWEREAPVETETLYKLGQFKAHRSSGQAKELTLII